jgi:RHS repeat-associated protein
MPLQASHAPAPRQKWRALFRYGRIGGLFALARFLAERSKRSWKGFMAPSGASKGGVCLRPKKKNPLNFDQLEQRSPVGCGVPAFTGALLAIGYQFDSVCAHDDSFGTPCFGTVPALSGPDSTQPDAPLYQTDTSPQSVEPQLHASAPGTYTPDDDSTWRPTDGAPSTVTDPQMDNVADQRDPDDPSGTVKPRDLGGGGASGGFPTAPRSESQAGQPASFSGSPSTQPQPIGPAPAGAGASTTSGSAASATQAGSAATAASSTNSSTAAATPTPTTHVTVQPAANLGVVFTQNVGQTSSQAQYVATGAGYSVFLTGGGMVMEMTSPNASAQTENVGGPNAADQTTTTSVVSMQWVGANANPQVQGEDPLTSTANYFIGQNSYTNVPQYSKVEYTDVYPDIGVQYYSNAQGQLEYDVIAGPGADLSDVKLSFEGANHVSIDSSGNLVLNTGAGNIVEAAPTLYQLDAQGDKVAVAGGFQLNADSTVSFTASYNPALTLYIDPVLENLGTGGGADDNGATAVAVDPLGNVYMTGWTNSSDFPTTTGTVQSSYGGGTEDAFIIKNPGTGYETYLGGSGQDVGWGIAFDSAGDAYVTGATSSGNFDTTTGLTSYHASAPSDTFVVKLDPTGSALLYSTVLDGTVSANVDIPAVATESSDDYNIDGGGIAVDAYDDAYVTGTTYDSGFGGDTPVNTFHGNSAFIVKLNSAGGLVTSVLLGGTTTGTSIAVDARYNIYAVGNADTTSPAVFSTTLDAYNPSVSGEQGYVVELSPSNLPSNTSYTWDYRALLGDVPSHANSVAVNDMGNAFVAGDDHNGSNYYNYALEMNAAGSGFVYDTNILTTSAFSGTATGISLDADGNAWVSGYNTSNALTTTVDSFASFPGGATEDGYLAEVDNSTYDVDFASYIGGDDDAATAVAQNPFGKLVVAGTAYSGDFPGEGFSYDDVGFQWLTVNVNDGSSESGTAPVITNVYSQSGPDVRHMSQYQALQIDGTAPDGSSVTLYRDGAAVTVVSVSSGTWGADDPDNTLPQGNYIYTATDELDGVTSELSGTYSVTVDTTPPVITITMASDITSESPIIQLTASDMVGLSSTEQVKVYVDSTTTHSTFDLSNGTGEFQMHLSTLGYHTVTADISDQAGNVGTTTVTFDVVSSSTWTLTDDTRQFDPLGTNIVSHTLDLDNSPGTDQSLDAALVYNSADVNPEPTILANLQTANSSALPTTMTVDLYWDGSSQGTVTYDPAGSYALGDQIPLSAQPTSAVTTGLHTYSLVVSFPGSAVPTLTISGDTFAVSENGSPFGAGWSFSPVDQLDVISATTTLGPYDDQYGGILREYGDGTWSFYSQTGPSSGIYTSPSGDFGTLSTVVGGFAYTTPDGEQTLFATTGTVALETGWKSVDGLQSISVTYESGSLHTISTFTAIDGTTSTFSFTADTITTPNATGNRIVTLTISSGDLTEIEDPDGRVESYSYSDDLMTADQLGDAASPSSNVYTSWDYSNGLVDAETSGDSAVSEDETATIQPFGSAPFGTAPAGEQWGSVTDPDGNTTWYLNDSYGRPMQQINPDGGISTWDLDLSGLPTIMVDALGNTTTYAYDTISGTAFTGTTTTGSPTVTGISSMTGLTAGVLVSGTGIPTGTQILSVGPSNQITLTNNATATGSTTITPAAPDGYLASETLPGGLGTMSFYYRDSTNADTGLTMRLLTISVDALLATTDYAYDTLGHPTTITQAAGTTYAMTMTYAYSATNGLVTAVYNSEGETTTYYSYDSTRLIGETDYTSSTAYTTQGWTYDANGNVETYTDNDGNTTTYTNDAMGRVLTQTLDSETQNWTYNDAGEESQYVDGNGNVESLTYNTRGDLVEDYQGYGSTAVDITLNQYNGDDEITASRDGDGNWTTYAYDGDGDLISQTDALGDKQLYDYNLNDEQVASRDADGNWTTETLNALGFVTVSTDGTGATTTTTVDAAGDATRQEDPDTNVTTYTFDVLGRLTMTEDASHNYTTTTYDHDDNVAATIDQNGITTTYDYDYQGQQLSQTVDSGGTSPVTTSEAYDGNGNVTASTDGNGNVTTDTYDPYGNLQTAQTTAGTTTYSYDHNNNLTTVVFAIGVVAYATTYEFNSLNQQIAETDPTGSTSWTLQDPNGNIVETIDGAGDAVANYYDAAGQLVYSIDGITQYQYDANGNLIAETDSDGNTTQWAYNARNQQTLEVSPTGGITAKTYDPAGNLSTIVDPDDREQEFNYTADNQLATVSWYSGVVSPTLLDTLTYTYYPNGSLETAGDNSGTYTFYYDALGNVTMVEDGVNGLTLTYEYDANHNVTEIADSKGGLTTSTYNNLNELTARTLSGTGVTTLSVSMSYDAAGRMTEIDRYTGALATEVSHSTYSYDGAGNMTGETESYTGGTITYANSYDAADRITTQVRQGGSTTTTTYDYDRTGQVTGVAVNGTPTATYSYDANGNPITTLTTIGTGNDITTDGTYTYTYDAAGNVTEMSMGAATYTWFFTYNLDNQVTSAKEYAAASTSSTLLQSVSNVYDVFGDLISRTVTPGGGGPTTTTFAYDVSGAGIGIDSHVNPVYAELSGGSITERYLYANGAIVARSGSDTNGTAWLLTDYEGSVREVLNATATTVEDAVTYDAFGNITSQTAPAWLANTTLTTAFVPFAFQGMMLDPTTGLNEAKYRFMLPDGQWSAQDQTGLGPDVNSRREMGNDAVNEADPSGLTATNGDGEISITVDNDSNLKGVGAAKDDSCGFQLKPKLKMGFNVTVESSDIKDTVIQQDVFALWSIYVVQGRNKGWVYLVKDKGNPGPDFTQLKGAAGTAYGEQAWKNWVGWGPNTQDQVFLDKSRNGDGTISQIQGKPSQIQDSYPYSKLTPNTKFAWYDDPGVELNAFNDVLGTTYVSGFFTFVITAKLNGQKATARFDVEICIAKNAGKWDWLNNNTSDDFNGTWPELPKTWTS